MKLYQRALLTEARQAKILKQLDAIETQLQECSDRLTERGNMALGGDEAALTANDAYEEALSALREFVEVIESFIELRPVEPGRPKR